MLDSLDWLVIVFMATSAAALLGLCLMFLMKNETVKKISLYGLAAIGVIVSWMNAQMTPISYMEETILGWGLGALSIAGVLLTIFGKSEKKMKIARILIAASVILGMVNAFMY